ncbi:hypothetical protein C7T94_17230 [Pedobacter yulinensis]|uniref:Bacterial surface antigen (D15) domain-containing protein n=1 Tax=Pedobacter yulinensis TaxID=2126353 RepID=A0A2T3HHL9_9SPHI|nr:BamA/TamA family outer membrane protein [Pedobacter yulinensis]PST81934.1 hypothetical protein C7T94_17230 [Pedobacter yulinensis]
MKAYRLIFREYSITAILPLFIVLIAGCSSTKYIEDYQSIVKKVTIDSVDKPFEEEAYNYVQKDIRPNSKFGINIFFYNLFNTKDGKYKTTNIKPIGSPPPILDSALVEISRSQIEKFLKSKGYFDARVGSNIEVEEQRASILFKATPGALYHVDKLSLQIPDKALQDIYNTFKKGDTRLRDGMRYDEDSLVYERERIYQIAKEHGYYDFLRPYIRYDVIDTAHHTRKVGLRLYVDNPQGKTAHKQYRIGETNILIAPNPDGFPDSVRFKLNPQKENSIRYTDFSKRFRRNPIVRYDFLKKGDVYDIRNENLTYDRMYELNVFKNVKIDFYKDSASRDTGRLIHPVIQLIPQKRMSNRIEGEIPFNAGTVGFTLSNTYTNNNLFRGAERFEFQVKGGLQSRIGQESRLFRDIYQRDLSVSANLTVPRLIIPFYDPPLGGNGMPHTTFSSSFVYALQKDVATRRIYINSITYDWVETKSKLHSFTPLNFEYRFGDLLLTVEEIANILGNLASLPLLERSDLTLGMKYTYSLNGDKLNQKRDFIYFRGNIDIAGNLLYGLSRLGGVHPNPNARFYGTILGLPYNQYVRPEVDVRWYKSLGGNRQFVARLNAGIGYGYGNSNIVPFEKMFFAGGSNGIRAWQARTVGPGNYNREVVQDAKQRQLLFGIDQIGEMRAEANFEYRFRLLDKFIGAKLNGAVFVDAGNVWNVRQGPGKSAPTFFKLDKLAQQLAVGTGVGFRYDVEYFVFRFDIGLKLKDPQFAGSDQWVIAKYFGDTRAFKDDYYARHEPDRYRFFQYNFGIGMPF